MDFMKKAVMAASLLGVLCVGLLRMPALAAPQLWGRDKVKQDKTRLLTGKVMDNGDNPLQRIVLIGDHHQNPPVIQNAALKQMEQSLFTRLVRLGVPAVQLDSQGRARPWTRW